MKLPLELVHRIQYDFAAAKYKDGTHVFNSVDDKTILVIINSLIDWAEEHGYMVDNTLDFTTFTTEK